MRENLSQELSIIAQLGNTGSSKLFYMPKRLGAKGFVPSFKGKQQLRELKTKCEWLEDEDGPSSIKQLRSESKTFFTK